MWLPGVAAAVSWALAFSWRRDRGPGRAFAAGPGFVSAPRTRRRDTVGDGVKPQTNRRPQMALTTATSRHVFSPYHTAAKGVSRASTTGLRAAAVLFLAAALSAPRAWTPRRAGRSRARARRRSLSRSAARVESAAMPWGRSTLLQRLKDFLFPGKQRRKEGIPQISDRDILSSLRDAHVLQLDASVIVTSGQAIGQAFCGEYVPLEVTSGESEREAQVRSAGRTIFKRIRKEGGYGKEDEGPEEVSMPGFSEGEAMYLFQKPGPQQQWLFSSSSSLTSSTAAWAFVDDAAATPWEIENSFRIWTGSTWVADPSLRVRVTSAGRVEEKKEEEEEGSAMTLPGVAEPLSMLHWKAQWRASERHLIQWPEPPSAAGLLGSTALPEHSGVKRGVLSNGLRYVLLRNAMPPRRFEAHLELHVGSVDEDPESEQGIAHIMEHVCFLGSRKRERLIGTGSRSNALTDFQHTIYHIHAPVSFEEDDEEDSRGSLLEPALEALHEIAFAPKMLTQRIEKERKAVLAEMQQVNDMEYRIETWTLSGLHETNKLGTQFPIGKEEQIKTWKQQDLRDFHEKWYYPGNATLYIVGDIDETEMLSALQKIFEPVSARNESWDPDFILKPVWGADSSDPRSLFRRKLRGHVRPEQLHNFSVPMIGTHDLYTEAASFAPSRGEKPQHGPLKIFRNELLEGVQMNFYAKAPVRPLRTLEDIRHLIAVRILMGVLQFRIVSRYSSNHAPVQIDHSDSFREGCAVTSIVVNADPRDWRNAVACVVQEVRAICDYGITESEMRRYMDAMLKDVEKGIAENDTVPSEDHLNFIMASDVFDHVVMDPDQSYQAFQEVAPFVTIEQVHQVAKWMLGFLGYYGMIAAPPPTAIVVCTPTQVFEESTGNLEPFDITEEEIVDLLISVPDKSKEEALKQVEVPESLLQDQLEKLLSSKPVDAFTAWRASSRKVDEATGIVQLNLPNGAKVNYACTATSESPSQGSLRLLVPGGRSTDEPDQAGSSMVGLRTISESGAVGKCSREQIELFAVSKLMSVHLDLNLEFSYLDASFSCSSDQGHQEGLKALLELLHLLFQEPRWELPAFFRAQQAYKAQSYAVQKSLEQSTLDRLMRMMYASDPRMGEPSIEDLNKLTLAKVRKAVSRQLRPQDLEINLVADFEGRSQKRFANVTEGTLSTGKHHSDPREAEDYGRMMAELEEHAMVKERRLRELDEALWAYLGSIPAVQNLPQAGTGIEPVNMTSAHQLAPRQRQVSAHLEDSDERAVAYLGGGAPNRWGKGDRYHSEAMLAKRFSWDTLGSPLCRHPLYPSVCLLAMREVINTRLFSTVRDSLGLSYDCSFELSMFDRLKAGWYVCTVSAHPSRIHEAIEAAKGVLQGVHKRPISDLELSAARKTLMRRHETDLQSNEYWISLLSHLQDTDNPKDLSCVRDIEMLFEQLTWGDVQNAYLSLLTDSSQVFVSVSTAGPGSSYVSNDIMPVRVSTSLGKEFVEMGG